MPFWSKKPSLEDQVLELRMNSKTLNMQYKKCLKDSAMYEKKMKAEVMKGNQEGAQIYAESAVRMKQQGRQFMIMASRVEAAAMTMQSVASMAGVADAMSASVSAINSAAKSLDMQKMYTVMDKFKNACEDNNVMMTGFMDITSGNSVSTSDAAAELMQQAQAEAAVSNGQQVNGAPLNDPTQVSAQAAPLDPSADLLNRLNNLYIHVSSFSLNRKVDDTVKPSMFVSQGDVDIIPQLSSEELKQRGIAEAERGECGKALHYLNQAIVMDPNDYKLCEMIAQIHLIQHRPFGAIKFSQKSVNIKPNWCEGHITLARAQRELGEVKMALASYRNGIDLFSVCSTLDDVEKSAIRREYTELMNMLKNYEDVNGSIEGRAVVVEDMESFQRDHLDYSRKHEIWKEEIENSAQELRDRQKEQEEYQNKQGKSMDIE